MNIFDELSIIIPPHNRHHHLQRLLDFLIGLPCRIYICDSSDTIYFNAHKVQKNVDYSHFPGSSFSEKIDLTLNKINTKYTLLYAEDDFYCKNGIKNCIEFLNLNHDYYSCQGNYKKFWIENNKMRMKDTYAISFEKDIHDSIAKDRIINFFSEYFQLFYAVHRTETLKDLFQYFNKNNITNMFAVEFAIALKALQMGKHKVLNINFGLREVIHNSVGRNKDNYLVFTSDKKYEIQYNAFKKYFYEVDLDNINQIYFNQLWEKRNPINRYFLKFRFLIIFFKKRYFRQRNDSFQSAISLIEKYKDKIN